MFLLCHSTSEILQIPLFLFCSIRAFGFISSLTPDGVTCLCCLHEAAFCDGGGSTNTAAVNVAI